MFQALYTIAAVATSIGAILVVIKHTWRWAKATVSKSYKLANTWNTMVQSVAKLVEFADDVRRLLAEGRDLMQKLATDIHDLRSDHETLRVDHEGFKRDMREEVRELRQHVLKEHT